MSAPTPFGPRQCGASRLAIDRSHTCRCESDKGHVDHVGTPSEFHQCVSCRMQWSEEREVNIVGEAGGKIIQLFRFDSANPPRIDLSDPGQLPTPDPTPSIGMYGPAKSLPDAARGDDSTCPSCGREFAADSPGRASLFGAYVHAECESRWQLATQIARNARITMAHLDREDLAREDWGVTPGQRAETYLAKLVCTLVRQGS